MELWQRVGTFLLLVGLLLIILFVLSDISRSVDFRYLLIGGICMVAGYIIKWSHPKPPPEPSNRFRILRESKGNKGVEKKKDDVKSGGGNK